MAKFRSLVALCGCGLMACSGARARPVAPNESAHVTHEVAAPHVAVAAKSARSRTMDDAHRIVIESVACWLGNAWGDAEGIPPAERAANDQARCEHVIEHAYGVSDPPRADKLRAIDPSLVGNLRQLVIHTAKFGSPERARTQQLGEFLEAAADAEREVSAIRSAANQVRADEPGTTDPARASADDALAVRPLKHARAFEALLGLDLGALTPEARTVAMLCLVDRMQAVRDLNDHLKVYALERPFTDLFNTTTPSAPADVREPLQNGVWVAYINAVAGAAGHAVSDAAASGADREALAWAGTLQGLGDKMHSEAQQMGDTTDLKQITENVVKRLDADYRATEASILHHPG